MTERHLKKRRFLALSKDLTKLIRPDISYVTK